MAQYRRAGAAVAVIRLHNAPVNALRYRGQTRAGALRASLAGPRAEGQATPRVRGSLSLLPLLAIACPEESVVGAPLAPSSRATPRVPWRVSARALPRLTDCALTSALAS